MAPVGLQQFPGCKSHFQLVSTLLTAAGMGAQERWEIKAQSSDFLGTPFSARAATSQLLCLSCLPCQGGCSCREHHCRGVRCWSGLLGGSRPLTKQPDVVMAKPFPCPAGNVNSSQVKQHIWTIYCIFCLSTCLPGCSFAPCFSYTVCCPEQKTPSPGVTTALYFQQFSLLRDFCSIIIPPGCMCFLLSTVLTFFL